MHISFPTTQVNWDNDFLKFYFHLCPFHCLFNKVECFEMGNAPVLLKPALEQQLFFGENNPVCAEN